MTNTLRITLAQLNFLVGDIEGNAKKIINTITTARDAHQANLIIFPELALTGYPPEDLLYRTDLHARINTALTAICEKTTGIDVILGHPALTTTGCYNRASFIHQQKITHSYDKQKLPNYSVFDEIRYFKPGPPHPCVIDIQGIKIAITICEDLWFPEPVSQAKAAGADLILAINASPFANDKAKYRQDVIQARIQENALPICYVNLIGGQDELVFDGGSMVFDHTANLVHQADFFKEQLLTIAIHKDNKDQLQFPNAAPPTTSMSEEECIYSALVLGVRDYVQKSGFKRVLLGLSGGIDSSLTLAIAVDALGKDRVQAIMMPSRYSANISLIDAKQQVEALGVSHEILSIEPLFQACLETLDPVFKGLPQDTAEENIQARCRAILLMAIANKKHAMVLTTSNKSETAVGYSTLYGDMAGGFCVLKDVFKTMVYRLARYRNHQSLVIPERTITRAPSAELAPNQKDQDSLPPYPILDAILERYMEHDESLAMIVQAGFDEAIVRRVIQLVDRNEYKRRQSPPGPRITERAFGKDRRYPIVSGFNTI